MPDRDTISLDDRGRGVLRAQAALMGTGYSARPVQISHLLVDSNDNDAIQSLLQIQNAATLASWKENTALHLSHSNNLLPLL